MARGGRKPKPTSLHELHGTYNTTRHGAPRAAEAKAPGNDLHEAPAYLSASQREGWTYAIRYAPMNVLKPIDRGTLFIFIQAEDAHRRATTAQAALDETQPVMPMLVRSRKSPSGFAESPYLSIIRRNAMVMLRAAAELGFTPASRPRIQTPGTPKSPELDSPWQRLQVLQGGKRA